MEAQILRRSTLIVFVLLLLQVTGFLTLGARPVHALPSISSVRTWGGIADETAYSTAVDYSTKSIYVTGATTSFGAGSSNVFVLKYDSGLNLVWERTWGGTGADIGYGIAVGPDGIYVTGATTSFGGGGTLYGNAFLIKYDSSGNLLWQRTWGGTGDHYGTGVTVDYLSNDVYVTGLHNYGPTASAFLLKFDSTGSLIWQLTWGGSGTSNSSTQAQGVAIDSAGNVFITGLTYAFGSGAGDVFLVKFSSAGTVIWQRTWGGTSYELGTGLAVDSTGNAYVTGQTESYGSGGACGTAPNIYQCPNVFLLKFDSSGGLTWGRVWGSTSGDVGQGVGLAGSTGDIYVTGVHIGSNDDVILLKFASNGVLTQQVQWGGTGYEYGEGVAVDSSGNAFVTGAASTPPYNFQSLSLTPSTLPTGTGTPSGTLSNPSITPGTPSGTVLTPAGSQTYAGAKDAFLFEYHGGANRRVTQTANSMALMQNEPSIAVNPRNTQNIVAGYNDFSQLATAKHPRPHFSYSADGGNTWTAGANALALPTGDTHSLCCDSALAFDSNGNAYYVTMDADFVPAPGYNVIIYTSAPNNALVAGVAWGAPVIVNAPGRVDKPAIAIDRTGGTHNGNIYVAWVNYTFTQQGIFTSMEIMLRTGTLLNGVPTFSSAAIVVSSATDLFDWGPAVAVGPTGAVYVTYFRMTLGSFSSTNSVMISRSDDGGVTLGLTAQRVTGVSPPGSVVGARLTALPTIAIADDGTIVVAWTDSSVGTGLGAGRADILSSRSTDNGVIWGATVTVNNDPTNTKTDHFLPAAAFAGKTLYIFFYDKRNDPTNNVGFLYAAKSTDEGLTFPSNFAVSDTFSDPAVCSSVWTPCLWGDYISATSISGLFNFHQFYVVWDDSRDSARAGDNDVNVYFETFSEGGLTAVTRWNWGVDYTHFILPFGNICQLFPEICHGTAHARILPVNPYNQTVNLYSANLPPGVSVSFNPPSGIPPFDTTITVDTRNATCTGGCSPFAPTIIANSTDGGKPQTLNLALSNNPFVQLNSNAFAPGTNLTIVGRLFTPNTTVNLILDGQNLTLGKTDAAGSVQLSAMIPGGTRNGGHTLEVIDTSGKAANANFVTFEGDLDPEGPIRAIPTISSSVTPSTMLLGGSARDLANLQGGSNPSGTITYYVYDYKCTVLLFTSPSVPLGSPSMSFTPVTPGTYQWVAAYSGDSSNNPVSTKCGDAPLFTLVNPSVGGTVLSTNQFGLVALPVAAALISVLTAVALVPIKRRIERRLLSRRLST